MNITAAVFLAAVFLMSFLTFGSKCVYAEEMTLFDEDTGFSFSIKDDGRLVVTDGDKEVFTTPNGVKVTDFILADIDRDSVKELLVLCYKKGKFGKHRPFWVTGEDNEVSQHIFIYNCKSDGITQKWMSSDIGVEVDDWSYEGNTLTIIDPEGEKTYWKWQSWGLEKAEDYVTIMAVGDNIIHSPIYKYASKNDMNFDFAYEKISPYVKKMDIGLFVSETPLVDKPEAYGDYPRFGTPCEISAALSRAGFDIAACATNHILDKDTYGLDCTLSEYSKRNIQSIGIDDGYVIKDVKGIKIAFLSYTDILNSIKTSKESISRVNLLSDEKKVRKAIKEAKNEADFVIMIVHWGDEYSIKLNEEQKRWAKVFLNEGVDVCIGSHPHVIQKSEILREGNREMVIYYSLGNFFSAQSKEGTDKGMAVYLVVGRENGKVKLLYRKEYEISTNKEEGQYYVSLSEAESR